jgi:selenocysteine lyase/cysteine desulfurase
MDRRQFLTNAALGGLALTTTSGFAKSQVSDDDWPRFTGNLELDTTTESFWLQLRNQFDLPGGYLNFENGYFSLMPISTLEFHQKREKYVNSYNSHYMRNEQESAWTQAKKSLADFLNAPEAEIAFTRNTTESLNIVISGYPWKKGDEVVIGNQDYGSMVASFKQVEKRFHIKVKVASVPQFPQSDDEVVTAYFRHVTPKTKAIHLTHLINLTGHVIPVAAIAAEAHKRGIEVIVDAAHSNAHIAYTLPQLGADYVAASLHKWLSCPLGTGYLWMKKEHIPKIWPLMGDSDFPENDIRKFEHQGTRPVHTFETIEKAIAFHNRIGGILKEKRLKYLSRKLCSAIADTKGIYINTPWQQETRNSAIVNIGIDGYTPAALAKTLESNFGIYTVAIDHPASGLKGVRITPHLYTITDEVNALAEALKKIAVF